MTEPLIDTDPKIVEQAGIPINQQNPEKIYSENIDINYNQSQLNEKIAPDSNYNQNYPQNQNNQMDVNSQQNYQPNPQIYVPPSNELGQMYKESPENNSNPLPGYSEISYGFPTIFSIYLIQSLIYIGLFLYGYKFISINSQSQSKNQESEAYAESVSSLSENIINWIVGIYTILSLILFISVRKYSESSGHSACSIFLFILFFIFKIFFFIMLYISFMDSVAKQSSEYNTHFLFSNSAAAAIYIALIVYSCLKKDISLLITFAISMLICVIFFVSLFPATNVELGVFVIILVVIEIIALLFSIFVAKKSDILEEDMPIHNILMIDYYKFFFIMLLSYLAVMFCLFMLYCACLIVGGCKSPSKATYIDNEGNVKDQYHKKMGIRLRKKPAYVDENGKFYDKHHREIKPDSGCAIF